MSTVFEVPCPECGGQMSVAGEGELRCPPCERTYHARMGHLFPVGKPPGTTVVTSESPPGRGPARRPTASTS
jgi:tRNA(Ile2) C34 agmatinyltransferase TiaS